MSRAGVQLTTTAVALAIATGVGACGGSKPKSHAHSNSQLAMAQCMRSHGATNFPDPHSGGGFTINTSPGSKTLTVDGIAFSGPAFNAAEKACKLFGGGTAPPPITERQKLAMYAFAKCMRAHGVPSYPDPVFPPGGGVERQSAPSPSRSAPAFQAAVSTCNKQQGSGNS